MDFSINFEPRCTPEEAAEISRLITLDIDAIVYSCYCNTCETVTEKEDDATWGIHSALDTVYMMGFLSGSRAIRKRNRKQST